MKWSFKEMDRMMREHDPESYRRSKRVMKFNGPLCAFMGIIMTLAAIFEFDPSEHSILLGIVMIVTYMLIAYLSIRMTVWAYRK